MRVAFDGVTVFSRDRIATAVAPTTSSVEITLRWVEGVGTPAAEVFIDNVALETAMSALTRRRRRPRLRP